jgi:hypothetical protein
MLSNWHVVSLAMAEAMLGNSFDAASLRWAQLVSFTGSALSNGAKSIELNLRLAIFLQTFSWSSSALASFRSAASKPSVNQP